MSDHDLFIQFDENTVHVGALVSLNDNIIIKKNRGKYLDEYHNINPKIISRIQVKYYSWMKYLYVLCLVGDYWFESNELKLIKEIYNE